MIFYIPCLYCNNLFVMCCVSKVIYVTRNPKDVMVSSYYFHKMAAFLDDPGTFQVFMDKFLKGEGQRLQPKLRLRLLTLGQRYE